MVATIMVVASASTRLWRLAAVDTITARPRRWLLDRAPGWVEDMIHCPWCLGTHVTVVVFLGWMATSWAHPVIEVAAAAHIVGLMGERT